MLAQSEYMPLGYLKKQRWTGSYRGMRFLLQRQEGSGADSGNNAEGQDWLEAVVWREPYSYEATPEEEKTRKVFPLTEEGREAAIGWLESEYDSRQAEWKGGQN